MAPLLLAAICMYGPSGGHRVGDRARSFRRLRYVGRDLCERNTRPGSPKSRQIQYYNNTIQLWRPLQTAPPPSGSLCAAERVRAHASAAARSVCRIAPSCFHVVTLPPKARHLSCGYLGLQALVQHTPSPPCFMRCHPGTPSACSCGAALPRCLPTRAARSWSHSLPRPAIFHAVTWAYKRSFSTPRARRVSCGATRVLQALVHAARRSPDASPRAPRARSPLRCPRQSQSSTIGADGGAHEVWLSSEL